MKHCPVCNSSKYEENIVLINGKQFKVRVCKNNKCGFTNKEEVKRGITHQ